MSNTTNSKIAVHTASAPPAAGPYSQAVRVGGLLFTAGQIPTDPKTGSFAPGGIREQTARVIENLRAVLEAGGSDLSQVVKTTVFLKDMNDFAAMNEVYGNYFASDGTVAPARSTVQAAALPRGAMVEIEVIAAVGEKG